MFFLGPEEMEDYHRDKRRRDIQKSHDDRVAALGGDSPKDEDEHWGGSDEDVRQSSTSPRLF
jgi:hypothetical protein